MSLRGRIGTEVGKFPTILDDFIATPHPSREESHADKNKVTNYALLTYLIFMKKSRNADCRK